MAALVLFAGLAVAAPTAVWAAGRYVASRWTARSSGPAAPPSCWWGLCPPGFRPEGASDATTCFEYMPGQEVDMVRSLPGVTSEALARFTVVQIGSSPDSTT